jgi:hypothetical protein
MRVTNNHNLPEPIYRALTQDNYSRGNSDLSVTQLIDSPRIRILKHRHNDEITEDASEMLWSVLGTAVHTMFEQHEPDGHVVEERLFAEVDDWVISGAIDLQRSESDGTITILDYKCTSVWSVIFGKIEWVKQLNFYGWLAEKNYPDKPVSGLKIVAVLRDWQRSKAGEDNYPEAPIVIVDIPLWSPEERERYVRDRVKAHQDADWIDFDGEQPLPFCSDEERWKKADRYAVKKKGAKRAVRVLDSEEDALAFIGDQSGLEIELRAGQFTRCKDNWCRVAQWCEQYENEAWT